MNTVMRVLGALSLTALAWQPAYAGVVYDANAGSAAGNNDALMSLKFPTLNVSVADDFVLSSDAWVSGITFWGVSGEAGAATDPASYQYSYKFYDQNFPTSAAFATGTVAASAVNSVAAGYNNWNDIPVYEVSFDLISKILLSANTTYWLELQAITTDSVAWMDFSDGNTVIGQTSVQSVNGSVNPLGTSDRAFTLTENPLPLPGTLFLMTAGILGWARYARS